MILVLVGGILITHPSSEEIFVLLIQLMPLLEIGFFNGVDRNIGNRNNFSFRIDSWIKEI